MKIKTSELIGPALDWAVAQAAIKQSEYPIYMRFYTNGQPYIPHWGESGCSERFRPSTNWSHGGPIVEREQIDTYRMSGLDVEWQAGIFRSCKGKEHRHQHEEVGPTPLIAAMRCYVASKLGEEVEVPDELVS